MSFQNIFRQPESWETSFGDGYTILRSMSRHFNHFRGARQSSLPRSEFASGGSLEMWRDYFGPKAHIYGVDINPDCKVYERDGIKVFHRRSD